MNLVFCGVMDAGLVHWRDGMAEVAGAVRRTTAQGCPAMINVAVSD